MNEPKRQTEMGAGWAFPGLARKAHYFADRDLVSACGRWMFAGPRDPEDGRRSPDDCAACVKRLPRVEGAG